MKRKGAFIAPAPLGSAGVSRKWTFFCAMLGFLLMPFMPVQFTSILTAVVWVFSGIPYALVFTVLGTFRLDSFPIFSGLQGLFHVIVPGASSSLTQAMSVGVMFLGNFTTAFLFKRLLVNRLAKRMRRLR